MNKYETEEEGDNEAPSSPQIDGANAESFLQTVRFLDRVLKF